MTQSHEKRVKRRVPIKMRVDYKCEDNFVIEYSTNISESGIFIKSTTPQPVGTKVELTFSPYDKNDGDEIRAHGEVIWVNEYKRDEDEKNQNPGMGIKFIHLSDKSREKIINLVKRIAIL